MFLNLMSFREIAGTLLWLRLVKWAFREMAARTFITSGFLGQSFILIASKLNIIYNNIVEIRLEFVGKKTNQVSGWVRNFKPVILLFGS
jgi:hypothetical protein